LAVAAPLKTPGIESPFDLSHDKAYQNWRASKLENYPGMVDQLKIDIENPAALTHQERDAIHARLADANLVIYRLLSPVEGKGFISDLGKQLGLYRLDGNLRADKDNISVIRVNENRPSGEYIPYTNKPLSWHTDGYYNRPDKQIRAIVMHCEQPALRGGDNAYLDHEMAYIHLRDANPAYIEVLQKPDAMTIPANIQAGKQLRPEQSGPVFSVDAEGNLHMRYSARAHSVVWQGDSVTREARECLTDLLKQDSAIIFRHQLKAGEGIISNNGLHNRTAFENDVANGQERILYRARYFDRARVEVK
jgi:alpha-ketoglutarate-dependent taurine dioxygenase